MQEALLADVIALNDKFDSVTEVSYRVKAGFAIDPQRKLTVDGDYKTEQWFISAKEIVFKPNSKLIFAATAVARRRELFVVAEKITVEGGIGTITWEKVAPPTAPDRGQAASGSPGAGDGANGNPGAHGVEGAPGLTGGQSPDLSIFVQTLGGGGNLAIDAEGGPGGPGGTGQKGGDGGAGARGGPARQARQGGPFGTTIWLPYCESGPGQGGNGGKGGDGGNGGLGGQGGNGGTVTICSDPNRIPTLRQALNLQNGGGQSGPGGAPGQGASGGAGGAEGELANFCNSANRNGGPGPSGQPGQAGQPTKSGNTGAQFDCYVTDQQFKDLFGYGI